ncbi:hypothetical protein Trydic_g1882 [Trypoxylus dichotomus]
MVIITAQQVFRHHYDVGCHSRVRCRHAINTWVRIFEEVDSSLKRKPPEAQRIPKNIEAVRAPVPKRLISKETCSSIRSKPNIHGIVLSSDETHFHLCGSVDKQNFRCWSGHNPREIEELPLYSLRVIVCRAIADYSVIDPYFFKEGGAAVIITADPYVEMLQTFLRIKLDDANTKNA